MVPAGTCAGEEDEIEMSGKQVWLWTVRVANYVLMRSFDGGIVSPLLTQGQSPIPCSTCQYIQDIPVHASVTQVLERSPRLERDLS